jgi:hypothetical protein
MKHLACVLAAATALAPARLAAADASPPAALAQTLFEGARSDLRRGDFAAAYPKLLESERIDPSNGTLLNLVLCEDRLGLTAGAWAHAKELVARLATDDSRRPLAERELADLAARLAALELDAAPRPAAASPLATAPPSRSEIPSTGAPRWVSWTALGVGAAGLVTGSVLGVLAMSRRSQVLSDCPAKECSDASSLAAAREGQRFFVGSLVALGVGALGASVGVTLLTRRDPGSRAAPAGAIVGYGGAF